MNVTWACLVTEEDDEIKTVRLAPLRQDIQLRDAEPKTRKNESTAWWGWLAAVCGLIVLLTCLVGIVR